VDTVVHWNIAGWARHRGDPLVARALSRAVLARAPLPVALTVNEVCSPQFDALEQALAPAGYSAAAAWSIPHFGDPRCASYGNAVFWRGGDGGVERLTYPDRLQIDGAATRERRTFLRVVSATSPFAVATTHPAPQADVAARQVALAAEWLAERRGGPPTVLAGDLNLPPWSRGLDVVYADHQEADRWPRRLGRPTHRGLRKLDYVFVPRDRLRIAGRIGIAFRLRLSDHARITASIAGWPTAGAGPGGGPT
jgi:endonuclease/exonuclease/phosphatase family metal-dependent hydrolase